MCCCMCELEAFKIHLVCACSDFQLRKSFFWFDQFTAVQWITSAWNGEMIVECRHRGDALGAHEKTNRVVTQWSFNVHPLEPRKKNRRRLWATFIVVAPTVWRERNWRLLSMSKTMPTASKLSEAPSCRLISVPRWTFAKFFLKDVAWRGWGGEVSWQNAKCRDCRQKCTFESSKVKNHRRALFL